MAHLEDLDLLAHELLDHCADALDTIPLLLPDLLGAPDRQFVYYGIPAFDCPTELSVYVTPILELDTTPAGLDAGKRANRPGFRNSVQLTATVTRCVPTGVDSALGAYTPPTVAEMNAASQQHNADAWAIWNYIHWVKSSGNFLSLCDLLFIDGLNALIPSGGSAGWTLTVRAVIDGYQGPIGS